MSVFGIGSKKNDEQKLKNHSQLCEYNAKVSADIENLEALAEVFEAFPGWEAFRERYIAKVRLPKLYAVAGKALSLDEKTRNQLAGQIAEAEFLAQSLDHIKKRIKELTFIQKEVQSKLMHEDSHKAGSE